MKRFVATFFAVILLGSIFGDVASSYANTTFSFSLPEACRTSAGVYREGKLVRTLWFNEQKEAGANSAIWDNLDDDGAAVVAGNYEIRLLMHNMKYQWDGLVGNSSTNMSGTTVHKGMLPLQDIAITGSKAFYATAYNEAHYAFHRFDTGNPQVRLDSWTWVADGRTPSAPARKYDCSSPSFSFAATDGAHVYFASPAGWESETSYKLSAGYVVANRVSDDGQPENVFSHGINLPDAATPPYLYPHGIRVGTQLGLSGLAVQKTGNLLAVAVAPDNRIFLVDKLSGDALGDFAVTRPKRIAFDAANNLWVAAGANVYCYKIQNSAPYATTLINTLDGFSNALAVAKSSTHDLIVVADGGASMQLKAFNSEGVKLWTYGQAGGYQKNGPAVTDDKFWFYCRANTFFSTIDPENTFITFAPDGTFWVGDGMNARTLHLIPAEPTPRVIERISMQPMSYCVAVDQNNPRRVFRNFLEFNVDYAKPLAPDNGSWTLVNNWAASLPASYAKVPDSSAEGIREVATLSNQRTYAQLTGGEFVELTATGIRPAGQVGNGNLLGGDSLYRAAPNSSNGSFESGDTGGWNPLPGGNPTRFSATAVKNAGIATDGNYYLDIQESGPEHPDTIFTSLYSGAPVIFSKGHGFILSFDMLNKPDGFDTAIVNLFSVDAKNQPAASIQPSPQPTLVHDGKWHSYKLTMTLPETATERTLQMTISFLKGNALAATTYEAYLDNFKLTQDPSNLVLIDRGNHYWYRSHLTGFDAEGNPQWGPETVIASVYAYEPSRTSAPSSAGTSALTSSGIVVCYEPTLRDIRHLGGIRQGETSWAWKAFPSIRTDPLKALTYPIGYYDLGNRVVAGGNIALTSGRNIIAGYHGEAWHSCQASQFMHFYDDGLFVGQFGVSGTDANGNRWPVDYSKDGYGGNVTCPALANHDGEIYLYMNDEWGTPLQRYHLIGAKDIRELSGTGALDSKIVVTPMTTQPARQ